jgi:DUF971 family protein
MNLENFAVIGDEVALAWSDGRESYLKFDRLRKACPCAACQGEPDVTGRVIAPKVIYREKSFELVRHEIVGGYAIRFFWADGHSTGIYSFDLLRRLGE